MLVAFLLGFILGGFVGILFTSVLAINDREEDE